MEQNNLLCGLQLPYFTTTVIRELENVSENAHLYSDSLYKLIDCQRRIVNTLLSLRWRSAGGEKREPSALSIPQESSRYAYTFDNSSPNDHIMNSGKKRRKISDANSNMVNAVSMMKPIDMTTMYTGDLNNSHPVTNNGQFSPVQSSVRDNTAIVYRSNEIDMTDISSIQSPSRVTAPRVNSRFTSVGNSHTAMHTQSSNNINVTPMNIMEQQITQQSVPIMNDSSVSNNSNSNIKPEGINETSLPLLQKLALMLKNAKKTQP